MDTMTKAATHTVTPTPEGFSVLSGTSGATYLVAPLSTGGAACSCAHGTKGGRIAARCSHVRAVEAFAARVLPTDPFDGFRDAVGKNGARKCTFCDGSGSVSVAACSHGARRGDPACSDACLKPQTCAGCFGSGVER
jgi:hypothetical protein